MRRLAIVAGVLVGLLVLAVGVTLAIDGWARGRAEREIERQVSAQLDGVAVDAHITGFPVVLRLLMTSRVDQLDVHATGVVEGPLRLAAVDVGVSGLRLDRSSLFGGAVVVRGVDRVTIRVELSDADISALIGIPVRFGAAGVTATVLGRVTTAFVTLDDRHLEITGPDFDPIALDLPTERYLPCRPSLAIVTGRAELACTITELPGAVLDAIGAGRA